METVVQDKIASGVAVSYAALMKEQIKRAESLLDNMKASLKKTLYFNFMLPGIMRNNMSVFFLNLKPENRQM